MAEKTSQPLRPYKASEALIPASQALANENKKRYEEAQQNIKKIADENSLLNKLKKENIEKSQKIPRYWKNQSADRYHPLVKYIVKQYYIENINAIDDEAWFDGRGNEKPPKQKEEDKKEEANNKQTEDKDNVLQGGEDQTQLTPQNKIDQEYENDYWYETESKYGSIQIKNENWEDPNCWHRQRWEYITKHPICPGYDVNRDPDPEDKICKKDFVKSAGLEKEVKAVETDINGNFLSGQSLENFKSEEQLERDRAFQQSMVLASSDFQQVQNERAGMSFDEQAENITVQQNLQGISHGLNNSLIMIDEVISPKLTTYVTTYLQNVLMSYTQQAIIDILSFDAREIIDMGMKLVPDYVKTPSEILKELLSDNESITNSEVEKAEEDLRNAFNDKLSYYAGKISDFGVKQLEKVNKELCMISYYSNMGPAWLNDRVQDAVSTSVSFSMKYIGIARNKAMEERAKFVEMMSRELAHRVATQECKKLEVLGKEKIDKANQKKTEALSKAKTQIQQAKLIIFGILGT